MKHIKSEFFPFRARKHARSTQNTQSDQFVQWWIQARSFLITQRQNKTERNEKFECTSPWNHYHINHEQKAGAPSNRSVETMFKVLQKHRHGQNEQHNSYEEILERFKEANNVKIHQNQSKPIKTHQNPSKLIRIHQNPSKSIKHHQNPSKPTDSSSHPSNWHRFRHYLVYTRQSQFVEKRNEEDHGRDCARSLR